MSKTIFVGITIGIIVATMVVPTTNLFNMNAFASSKSYCPEQKGLGQSGACIPDKESCKAAIAQVEDTKCKKEKS